MSSGWLTRIAIVATLACTTRDWAQRESFRGQLRCGQRPHEIQAIALQSHGTGWVCGPPSQTETHCNFVVGRTRVRLSFEDGGLRRVEEGERFGLTGVATLPRLDVCTRQLSRQFVIVAPTTDWVGATISVDGDEVARVLYRNDSVYLPVGQHTLRIVRAGREALVRKIDVPEGLLREPPEIRLP